MGTSKIIVQLDYYTGEAIEEYKSISQAAHDNWIEHDVLSYALRNTEGYIKKRKLRFRYK